MLYVIGRDKSRRKLAIRPEYFQRVVWIYKSSAKDPWTQGLYQQRSHVGAIVPPPPPIGMQNMEIFFWTSIDFGHKNRYNFRWRAFFCLHLISDRKTIPIRGEDLFMALTPATAPSPPRCRFLVCSFVGTFCFCQAIIWVWQLHLCANIG